MKIHTKITTLATAAGLTLAAGSASAAVSVVNSLGFKANSGTLSASFDTTGATKIVVFLTGEHGFNNTSGQVNDVTFDGVSLTRVVDRNPVASGTDTLYGDIWYMDAPASGNLTLSASVSSRGSWTAFAISGAAAGVGDSGFSGSDTRSLDLTTGANSLVLAAFNLGGSGNSASMNGVSPDAPNLSTTYTTMVNSSWDGHMTAGGSVVAAGTNSFSFTGGNATGGFVTGIEILDAVPEPSTTALLGLGGLALILRRRK